MGDSIPMTNNSYLALRNHHRKYQTSGIKRHIHKKINNNTSPTLIVYRGILKPHINIKNRQICRRDSFRRSIYIQIKYTSRKLLHGTIRLASLLGWRLEFKRLQYSSSWLWLKLIMTAEYLPKRMSLCPGKSYNQKKSWQST